MSTTAAVPNAVELSGLRKSYGSSVALDGVDLLVPTGSVFGLIGPNGAGKTTTMRILLDLVRPTSGEVRVLGQVPREGGPVLRQRLGYLPGELRVDARSTGRAVLNHFARLNDRADSAAIDALADRLGLDLDRPVRALSKGNKQKLGLVQAFLHRPDLLILDEPTSGLDPLLQQEFLAMVHEAKQAGQTVFLSSHVLSEIQQAADQVAILRDGRVVSVSSVETLRLTAARRVSAELRNADGGVLLSRLAGIPNLGALKTSRNGEATLVETTLQGSADALVKALAGFTVQALVIEEPDLEQAVLGFYSSSGAPDA